MADKPQDSKDKQDNRTVQGIKLVPSPNGIVDVYANFIDASWTQFDVRIRLAQVISKSEQPGVNEFVAEERAAVTMSWSHLKLVNMILTELVSRYEATNGEIPKPKIPVIG